MTQLRYSSGDSVGICSRFRCGLQRFWGGRKALSVNRTDLKSVRWRYDWCTNARENFQNLKKMGAKFVTTTSAIYKRNERKILPWYFTPCIVDVHPYKNISLTHYRVPQKFLKFVQVMRKCYVSVNMRRRGVRNGHIIALYNRPM